MENGRFAHFLRDRGPTSLQQQLISILGIVDSFAFIKKVDALFFMSSLGLTPVLPRLELLINLLQLLPLPRYLHHAVLYLCRLFFVNAPCL